ncbi:FG-GAP-like repeat-containing protein [Thaumasiovibrio subtropicus]|uniref:FG-GAP-like repeat-containing protein n=1 Tax=Thaumasiovibrio subtropicus TaxID=1891207 RepID=UPI00131C328D|nr:FG-GAP-like repeat-containing protein [Thaumasiovibrio subtropicus]
MRRSQHIKRIILIITLSSMVLAALLYWHSTSTPNLSLSSPFSPAKTYSHPTPASIKIQHPLPPTFADRTLAFGLHHRHKQSSGGLHDLTETFAGGACVFDFDQDGWQDLFVIGGSGDTRPFGKVAWWQSEQGDRLYRNQQGTAFQLTHVFKHGNSMGCAVGDLDNNGREELIVSTIDSLYLYHFDESKKPTAVVLPQYAPRWFSHVLLTDLNHDGLTDIYALGFIRYQRGARAFEARTGLKAAPNEYNPAFYDAEPNLLLLNQGALTFQPSERLSFVEDKAGRGVMALSWDADGNGRRDLYIANAAGSASPLLLQDVRPLVFTDNTTQLLPSHPQGAFSASLFPQRHSRGWPSTLQDTALSNARPHNLILSHPLGLPPSFMASTKHDTRYQNQQWSRHLAKQTLLHLQRWGHLVADFNHDGHPDIMVRTGGIIPEPDDRYSPIRQPDQLQLAIHGQFQTLPLSDAITEPTFDASGRSGVVADFDNDGDSDLFLTNNNSSGQLLINHTEQATYWIGIDLLPLSGAAGLDIGLEVHLQSGDILSLHSNSRIQLLSYGDRRFLIPSPEPIAQVTVHWPDGSKQTLTSLPQQGYVTWRQGEDEPQTLSHSAQHTLDGETLPFKPHHYLAGYQSARQWLAPTAQHNSTLPLDNHTISPIARYQEALLKRLARDTPFSRGFAQGLALSPRHIQAASLLPALFANSSTEIQHMALTILQRWELEETLPLLRDALQADDLELRCHANRVMAYFFQQEEALPHRKWLLLPDMIAMLDQDPQPCQLTSLGHSERYRALHALRRFTDSNEVVNHPNRDSLILAAIQGLGLLKQREAINDLHRLLRQYSELSTPTFNEAKRALATITSLYQLADAPNTMTDWLDQLSAKQTLALLKAFQHYPQTQFTISVFSPAIHNHLNVLSDYQQRDALVLASQLTLLSEPSSPAMEQRLIEQWQQVEQWQNNAERQAVSNVSLSNTLNHLQPHRAINDRLYWQLFDLLPLPKQRHLLHTHHAQPIDPTRALQWITQNHPLQSHVFARFNRHYYPTQLVRAIPSTELAAQALFPRCQQLPYWPASLQPQLDTLAISRFNRAPQTAQGLPSGVKEEILCLFRFTQPRPTWQAWLNHHPHHQARALAQIAANPHPAAQRWLLNHLLTTLKSPINEQGSANNTIQKIDIAPLLSALLQHPQQAHHALLTRGLSHPDQEIQLATLNAILTTRHERYHQHAYQWLRRQSQNEDTEHPNTSHHHQLYPAILQAFPDLLTFH